MSHNEIGEKGADSLLQSLHYCSSIRELSISTESFPKEGEGGSNLTLNEIVKEVALLLEIRGRPPPLAEEDLTLIVLR